MKKAGVFIIGVITGSVLTILILALIGLSSGGEIGDNGVTMFEEPGDYMGASQFEIFQVLEPGVALANTRDESYETITSFTGPVVLFINDSGKHYYDDEVIEVPRGKRARQVGIYKYSTKIGYKTVPIVKIFETNGEQ
jgi:hypothetical protein